MTLDIYRRLAKTLDSLPNGFPSTADGLELRILQHIFTPDEAELFCDLQLTYESAVEVSKRTGRPLDGLEEKLIAMCKRGEIKGLDIRGEKKFRMQPWVIGIYEQQGQRLDPELCALCEEYGTFFTSKMAVLKPHITQVVPIEENLPSVDEAMPYEVISSIIRGARSFRVGHCMCKKSQRLLGHPCSKPEEVCMAVIRADGVETLDDWGRAITKDEAIAILRRAEEAGLVHLTNNLQNGHWFVCNCCGCCCAVLRTINEMDVIDVVNTHFYASIDPGRCKSCGTCREKRCQVRAIQAGPRAHEVDEERCIGCGLCVSTCPEHAIELVRKSDAEDVIPLKDDAAWNSERARRRSTPAGQ